MGGVNKKKHIKRNIISKIKGMNKIIYIFAVLNSIFNLKLYVKWHTLDFRL
jgi:hypothetical protein